MIGDLDEAFWSQRYKNGQTGWDIGYVSTPIKEFVDQLEDKSISILIPGAGNGYEAEYLFNQGFKNVVVLDISAQPLQALKQKVDKSFHSNLIQGDFFEFDGSFDLILEQTFFSAINPSLRPKYVQQMLNLLKRGGKVCGVLFDDPLFEDHPPFGGNKEIYSSFFDGHFKVNKLERCYNSIPPRAGKELWIELEKP